MKRMLLGMGFLIWCTGLVAQQDYYLFIQETTGQPFYVRLEEKNHSSSPKGHIILSQLRDSTYQLYIGFPRNRYPEQLFQVAMEGKDRGFELKNMNGEWQLFDLQKLLLIKPVVTDIHGGGTALGMRKTDSYSSLMAGVVNDSAVLYTYMAKAEVKKKDSAASVKAIVREDVKAVAQDSVIKREVNAAADSVVIPGAPDLAKEVVKDSTFQEEVFKGVKKDSVVALIAKADSVVKKTDTLSVANPADQVPEVIAETKPLKDSIQQEEALVLREGRQGDASKDSSTLRKPAALTQKGAAKEKEVVAKGISTVPVKPDADILRMLTENTAEGKLMIYIDRTGPVTDTIRLIIPRL